jgi:hypothetical protein
MRGPIRKIGEGYKSLKLEVQDDGLVLYSGQDPNSRQKVSIKVLPRVLGSDPQIAERFHDLAQGIRQLNHPNITTVRKVGEEGGLPFLVTRALEKGQPLAAKLDQPWAVDAAADVVMQVGQALEHAYRKGVSHGSLSPEAIVVQDDGRVQVSDLGLAELQRLVGAQVDAGASPYQAPERAAGEAPDAESDVYALGAVLYNLLAKRSPQVVGGQVLPPSRFNPDVLPAMDAVVVKALAQDPEARYPDPRSFLAALGAVSLAPMVRARPPKASTGCPTCGAKRQTGRFCRKCGARLEAPESVLDEPIQVTKVEVGQVEVGKGVEILPAQIAQPMAVASGEVSELFPEPLAMPELDCSSLWPVLGEQGASAEDEDAPAGAPPLIAMPEPSAMPIIDWAEVAPAMPEVPAIEDRGADEGAERNEETD